MTSVKYLERTNELVKAIDIAIESFKLYPPKDFEQKDIDHMIAHYLEEKEMALNPKPKYRNLTSLNYQINDVLTLFKEGNGEFVEYFWEQIKVNNIQFKREHLIFKILKRNKIKNDFEFEYINDVAFSFLQQGLISKSEMDSINEMLRKFESR